VELNTITERVIGAAMDVHRHIGPGLLESCYETCLCHELKLIQMPFERQVALPVEYKSAKLDCGYRMDLVVANAVVVELKAIDQLLPIHEAQLLTYLRLSSLKIGLLINFNVSVLKNGIRRRVHDL